MMAPASNAIPIPSRTQRRSTETHVSRSVDSAPGSSAASGSGFAYGSYSSTASGGSPSGSPGNESKVQRRRESLMSATFSQAEHAVINVGEEESPRLITCVKASQGFDWNMEIFLPSYADYHFDDLERRQDPVQDIILTDEEVKNMFPS